MLVPRREPDSVRRSSGGGSAAGELVLLVGPGLMLVRSRLSSPRRGAGPSGPDSSGEPGVSVGRRPGLRFGDRLDGSVVIFIGIGVLFPIVEVSTDPSFEPILPFPCPA